MAWQSSGTTNEEMVDNMKRFGVIHSNSVVEAFRAVDRRYFVPDNSLSRAHLDEPIREGQIHISAPHIYGCIVEALHVTPNSSMSFLNIGSGTGYLSTIVARMLGPTGMCYGIELSRPAYDHGIVSVNRWKEDNDEAELPLMEFIHGNGLLIDTTTGEATHGFDRIYVGAAIDRSKMSELASLLRLGGILVGPVEDELVQVTRVRNATTTSSGTDIPRSVRGAPPALSPDFNERVVTGVRFASLVNTASSPTVIPSRIWGPSLHKHYPETFRNSCKEILLCSQASTYQPPPAVAIVKKDSTINVAAQLPKSIWIEILSYTHRDWFERPQSEAEVLRRRLEHEQETVRRADEARRDAEIRLRSMERERDGYRRLALRTQARLQAMVDERGGSSTARNESEDMLTDDESPRGLSRFSRSRVILSLNGMNAFIRQFEQDMSDDDHDDEIEDEEEDIDEEVHANNNTEMIIETMDDDSTSSADDYISEGRDSISVSSLVPTTVSGSLDSASTLLSIGRQSRTVSMSSDDVKMSRT